MSPPEKPEESDCCGSGCDPCIFDIYQQQLDRYHKLNQSAPCPTNNCISHTKYSLFRLTDIKCESLDTQLYTFVYVKQNPTTDNNTKLLFLPGQHFLMRGTQENLENSHFTRAYTLIIKNDDGSSFTVLIKLYAEGKMSGFIRKLSLGADTYWRGPYGAYQIDFGLKHVLMVCQGTGIAPIYAVINRIIENDACETLLKLFYCCRCSESIHLRAEIHKLASYWNFKYEIFLSRTEFNFRPKYNERINFRRLQQQDMSLYFQSINCNSRFQVLICGSEEFSKNIAECVKSCGIGENFIHLF